MTDDVQFPDVTVPLTELDGNVFVLIGAVTRALRRAGYPDEALEFRDRATSSATYDEVLQLIVRTVNVE